MEAEPPSDLDEIASPSYEEHDSDAGEEQRARSDSEEEGTNRDDAAKSDSEGDEEMKNGGGAKSESDDEDAKRSDGAKSGSDEDDVKDRDVTKSDSDEEETKLDESRTKSESDDEETKNIDGAKSDSDEDDAERHDETKSDSDEEEAKHHDETKSDSDEEEVQQQNVTKSDSDEDDVKHQNTTKSDLDEDVGKSDSDEEVLRGDDKAKSDSGVEAAKSESEGESESVAGKETTSRRDSDDEGEVEKDSVADVTMKSDSEDEAGVGREVTKSDDEDVTMKSDSEDEDDALLVVSKGEPSEEVAKSDSEDEVVREDVESEKGSDVGEVDNASDRHSVGSKGDHDEREIEERASIHSDGEAEPPATPLPEKQPDEDGDAEGSDDDDSDDSSDEDSDSEQVKVGELIADIFGESDEDEEFEGFGEEDVAAAKKKKEKKKKNRVLSDSEGEVPEVGDEADETAKPDEEGALDGERPVVDGEGEVVDDDDDKEREVTGKEKHSKKKLDDSDDDDVGKAHIVYDFDLMLEKKKEESGRRRKYKNVDIINDSDDLIADLLTQMKTAADEDRELNKKRIAATKKLKMLPLVVSQLKKLDLKVAFLDQGVLGIMHEWLMPLPDRSLPHLQIRTQLLALLGEFPPIDQGALKTSGIGRAVMYLYKHPKETRENKEKAGKLISEWSRPIFNLNTNFSSMSKEEREHRDFEHMPKKRKLRLESGDDPSEDINSALTGDDRSLKPGDKGWVGRARVPLPSMRDYVVRPKWNVDTEFTKGGGRKSVTRLDKHIRILKERKKQSKIQRAVTISIEGRKMSL